MGGRYIQMPDGIWHNREKTGAPRNALFLLVLLVFAQSIGEECKGMATSKRKAQSNMQREIANACMPVPCTHLVCIEMTGNI